jgi:hypothetical protein
MNAPILVDGAGSGPDGTVTVADLLERRNYIAELHKRGLLDDGEYDELRIRLDHELDRRPDATATR